MKVQKVLLPLILVSLIGTAAITWVAFEWEEGGGGRGKEKLKPLWLTVHYVAMDNNLDSIGEWEADLHSLMKVGSTPLSQHVVLYDGDGSNDTVIQYVLKGEVEEYPVAVVNGTWGEEVNTGDGKVLEQFLLWAYHRYPARRVALVLNDHGGGWRGICWDDTSSDFLTDLEVREALESFYESTGKRVDVLLTYACIMSTLEFLYAIQPYVDYFVGSQTFSWGSETHGEEYLIGNYPFDRIFSALRERPNMTGEEFALHIVDSFQPYGPWTAPEFYVYRDYTSDVVAAVNLSQIPALVDSVDRLAKELLGYLRGVKGEFYRTLFINRVIGSPQMPPEYNTQSFSGQMDWIGFATFTNYDLKDLAIQIEKSGAFSRGGVEATLKNIKNLVDSTVMKVRHGTDPSRGEHPDAHGISIWLPFRRNEYRDSYRECLMAKNTEWDEFLIVLSQAS